MNMWSILKDHGEDGHCPMGALMRCAARLGIATSLTNLVEPFNGDHGYDQAVVESHPITNLIWIAAKDMACCGRKELLDVVKLLFPVDPSPDGSTPSTATGKSDIAQRHLMKNLSCVFKKVKSTPSSNNISMIIVLVAMLILLCEEVSLRGYDHELHCTLVEFFDRELHALDVVHYKRCQQTQSTFTNCGIPQMLTLITIMSILASLTLSYII